MVEKLCPRGKKKILAMVREVLKKHYFYPYFKEKGGKGGPPKWIRGPMWIF